MLKIWMFGALSVASGDAGSETVAVSGRCGSLLAYLALGRGRYFSRSDLLDVLWPEKMSRIGAGTFNTALWRLRRIVEKPPLRHGELIASDRRGAVGLIGATEVWLDTEHFERLIASGLSKPIESLADAEIDALREGVAMYTSDILPEYAEDWALREREKLRRHYLNALWRLMQIASIRRQWNESIAYAQAILDCDALREDVHRELMRLYVFGGQRAQALRQFEICRDLLRRELAIPPMRETLNLYRQIADSALAADGVPQMQVPLPIEPLPWLEATPTPPTIALRPTALRAPGDAGAIHPRIAIAEARKHLAAADAQLELGLRALED